MDLSMKNVMNKNLHEIKEEDDEESNQSRESDVILVRAELAERDVLEETEVIEEREESEENNTFEEAATTEESGELGERDVVEGRYESGGTDELGEIDEQQEEHLPRVEKPLEGRAFRPEIESDEDHNEGESYSIHDHFSYAQHKDTFISKWSTIHTLEFSTRATSILQAVFNDFTQDNFANKFREMNNDVHTYAREELNIHFEGTSPPSTKRRRMSTHPDSAEDTNESRSGSRTQEQEVLNVPQALPNFSNLFFLD